MPTFLKTFLYFIIGNTYKKPSERLKNVVKTESLLDKDEKDLTEEEKAAKALLEESKNWQENRDNEEVPNANLVIESSANNGILDEKALFDNDVESRPEVSSQDDYESIPVEGETQCENFLIFLSLRFYVKPKLVISEVQNCHFDTFRASNFLF